MITERTAIQMMFNNLEQDKQQIKRAAREEIDSIEKRQEALLDRLKRLDDQDRQEVDLEGTLHSLADTAKQLADLIPQVPALDVLELAAQKIAAQQEAAATLAPMIREAAPAKTTVEKAAEKQIINSTTKKKPELTAGDVAPTILNFLKTQKGKVKPKQIEKHIYETTGRKWSNFTPVLVKAREKYPDQIEKIGYTYSYKEGKMSDAETYEIGGEPIQENGAAWNN